MTAREAVEKRLLKIEKMDYPTRGYYSVPVETAVQEAYNLYDWCEEDKKLLKKDKKLFLYYSELPLRADCLKTAQTRWIKVKTAGPEIEHKIGEMFREGEELRRKLEHDFFYFFRNIPDRLEVLQDSAKLTGKENLIQLLTNYVIAGRAEESLKDNPYFNYDLLDKAELLSDELADEYAVYCGWRDEKPTLHLRNQASWHLKEAVNEIRRFGQWKHLGNPDRYDGYVSAFLKEKRRRVAERRQVNNM